MDLLDVLQPFFDYIARFCAVTLTFGGFTFSVGALFLWCALATIVIGFLKGLA